MPDLRFTLESAVLRALLNLPPGLQRRLARRPVVIDGQALAPELQLMLSLQRLARLPELGASGVEDGRTQMRRMAQLVGGRPPVAAYRDLEVPGATGPLRSRLYTPHERLGADPAPTLLFLHGGGWIYGDLESHDAACRFLAERAGVQVLAVEYRLAPEHPFPAGVEDCTAAYRWLVEHAAEVNADPARLGVGGDSAGGTLSADVAVYAAEQGLPLALQLLIYPGTDFLEETGSRRSFQDRDLVLTRRFIDDAKRHYLPDAEQRAHPDASPLRREVFPDGLARAHVVTAALDPLRDEGEAYAALLARHDVKVDVVREAGMVHGFLQIVGAGHEAPAAVGRIADALRAGLA